MSVAVEYGMDTKLQEYPVGLLDNKPQKDEDKYQAYIGSSKWRSKAERVKKRDNYQCQTCLETERLEVHHKTYEHLYHEPLKDLITLCVSCHEAITNTIRERRYAKRVLEPADVTRVTPIREKDEGKSNGTPDVEVSDYRRSTPAHAQRSARRPTEQMVEGYEGSQRKA